MQYLRTLNGVPGKLSAAQVASITDSLAAHDDNKQEISTAGNKNFWTNVKLSRILSRCITTDTN